MSRVLLVLVLVGGSPSLPVPATMAQSAPASPSDVASFKAELERIKAELDGLRGELRLLREFLRQRLSQPTPSAPTGRTAATVAVAGNPTLGRPDAPVTLIEFSDYQCPFCGRFFETTLPMLKAQYIDTGKLRYVFRDFPLDSIHPQARKAAEAAHCAGDQGQYWAMHDVLFRNQRGLQVERLKAYAASLALDADAFEACLTGGKYANEIQRDYEAGLSAGVRGTPAFFLGKTRPDDTIAGIFIAGARPFGNFQQAIERLRSEKQ